MTVMATGGIAARAQDAPGLAGVSTNSLADPSGPATSVVRPAIEKSAHTGEQNWNWHVQNTDIVQGYPGFPAQYSGPNSLPSGGETRETVSLDLYCRCPAVARSRGAH